MYFGHFNQKKKNKFEKKKGRIERIVSDLRTVDVLFFFSFLRSIRYGEKKKKKTQFIFSKQRKRKLLKRNEGKQNSITLSFSMLFAALIYAVENNVGCVIEICVTSRFYDLVFQRVSIQEAQTGVTRFHSRTRWSSFGESKYPIDIDESVQCFVTAGR
jgi:hypothetical protein